MTKTLPPLSLDQLSDQLAQAIKNAKWTKLMPVQAKSLPYILAGDDIKVQSRTGSGKTGAFVLPMIEKVDPKRQTCQALVMCPTRELANQVAREAEILTKGMGIRTVAVIGGTSYTQQNKALRRGAHIVVGTPGRVIDHLYKQTFRLDDLQMLVLDEADRMLSIGFYPDMKAVRSFLPDRPVITCMFSATFPPHVLRLANEFLTDPITLSLSSDHVHVTEVEHVSYAVPSMEKDRVLVRLLEIDNPESAILFCNQKRRVEFLTTVLERFGFNVDYLSGDLQQRKRDKVLKRIRDGKLQFLVATDVAARGIDIPQLSHVYQVDVPNNIEDYIHRAGRTGRAGASGTAITLVDIIETVQMKKISQQYKIDFLDMKLPDKKTQAETVGQRARVLLSAELRERDDIFLKQIDAFEPMIELLTMDANGIRALALLIDRYYHLRVHATNQKPQAPPKLKEVTPLTEPIMHSLAQALHNELEKCDQVQNERITRFESSAEQLAMSGDRFRLLTMLLVDFYLAQ